jgi:hypothetical protein
MPPSIRSAITNLGAPMPWRDKLIRLLANNWIKIRKRSNCCGNQGEPGC